MSATIIERERELAELAAAAEEAMAGDGSVVLIAGEAGIGKSSLVDAAGLGAAARRPGFSSATATTWPLRGCSARCGI